jgi:hypothetical protein
MGLRERINNSEEHIEYVLETLPPIIKRLREISPTPNTSVIKSAWPGSSSTSIIFFFSNVYTPYIHITHMPDYKMCIPLEFT